MTHEGQDNVGQEVGSGVVNTIISGNPVRYIQYHGGTPDQDVIRTLGRTVIGRVSGMGCEAEAGASYFWIELYFGRRLNVTKQDNKSFEYHHCQS
jgi:hypothetical protein